MIEPRLRHSPPTAAPIVSYSQNAEDVRLARVFGDVEDGFYVDVGAADPVDGSVTQFFYERGWSGINIEPSPAFETLRVARERDVNLRLAVGASEGSTVLFLTYPDLGMSTVDPAAYAHVPEAVERTEQITVPQRRLASILREHASDRTIHFLKIDVEGAEHDVLASSDWDVFRPVVVVVEAVEPWSTTPTHDAWEPILLDADYEFAAFDGINRFYVDRVHHDLIPTLAYPVGSLDHYVTASARDRVLEAEDSLRETQQRLDQAEDRLRIAESRAGALEVRLEQLQRELDRIQTDSITAAAESEALRRSLHHTQAELTQTKHELYTVYRSPTWRAGRMIAVTGKPVVRLTRFARGRRLPSRRIVTPARGFAHAAGRGQPWHFPRDRARGRLRRGSSPLKGILDRFGAPHVAVDAGHAAAIAEQLERTGWSSDESLLAKRLSWEERQAIIEADAIVGLVRRRDDDAATAASTAGPVVVVDARCLQDPLYATRGVGLHGRRVLEATRLASTGLDLVLLTSVDLPDLDGTLIEMADHVVVTPYAVRTADVALFLELSPMTASCAATVPLLGARTAAKSSVMFDFIPTRFPAAYLGSDASALANRARIEALRHYDLLLPISEATEAESRRLFGETTATAVSGVGDPLHGVSPEPAVVERPFMLVSAGGDPRKNVAGAVAALASHHRAGGGALRAVVTGVLTQPQADALRELAGALGVADDLLELRGYVADAELAGLYHAAELAFVGSLAEGFSIPVAEAVLRGTPVVASDITAHRELVGVGSWLAPATDVDGLGRAIGHVRRNRTQVAEEQRSMLGDTADPTNVRDRIVAALEPLLRQARGGDRRPSRRTGRPRIAVVSPFPPQKSGVADYTAHTFRQVERYAEVDVYAPPAADGPAPTAIRRLSATPYLDRRLDAVVNVVGNSHLHFPILDFLGAYGGACISHDNRMLEAYRYDRGNAWTAKLLSRSGSEVQAEDIDDLLLNLDRLPAAGFDLVARLASPLIVHGSGLAQRIRRETGVSPVVVPFVPYNIPDLDEVDEQARDRARQVLGLSDECFHVGTFGIVDSRTKGSDLVLGALSWLRSWGRPAHLHIVGEIHSGERTILETLAAELGIASDVTLHGHVPSHALRHFLLAVDMAVQIRTSAVLSLSGALADCIAFGVPTVTTEDVADEMGAPRYVVTTGCATSSLLIAEALDGLCERRRLDGATIEAERRAYLADRTVDAYARGLLAGLGLWSE
jgi:FkbM family methyltransferase